MKLEMFIVGALTLCVIAACFTIAGHIPDIHCFDWFGLVKGCAAVKQ